MSVEQPIEIEGTVTTVLPGTMFRVLLDNRHEVLATFPARCADTSSA